MGPPGTPKGSRHGAAASGALILDPVLRRILDVHDETPELALWVTTGRDGAGPAVAGPEELMAIYQQAEGLMGG